eukprot:2296438-Pleurochrysis_carterae.AAC.2
MASVMRSTLALSGTVVSVKTNATTLLITTAAHVKMRVSPDASEADAVAATAAAAIASAATTKPAHCTPGLLLLFLLSGLMLRSPMCLSTAVAAASVTHANPATIASNVRSSDSTTRRGMFAARTVMDTAASSATAAVSLYAYAPALASEPRLTSANIASLSATAGIATVMLRTASLLIALFASPALVMALFVACARPMSSTVSAVRLSMVKADFVPRVTLVFAESLASSASSMPLTTTATTATPATTTRLRKVAAELSVSTHRPATARIANAGSRLRTTAVTIMASATAAATSPMYVWTMRSFCLDSC